MLVILASKIIALIKKVLRDHTLKGVCGHVDVIWKATPRQTQGPNRRRAGPAGAASQGAGMREQFSPCCFSACSWEKGSSCSPHRSLPSARVAGMHPRSAWRTFALVGTGSAQVTTLASVPSVQSTVWRSCLPKVD